MSAAQWAIWRGQSGFICAMGDKASNTAGARPAGVASHSSSVVSLSADHITRLHFSEILLISFTAGVSGLFAGGASHGPFLPVSPAAAAFAAIRAKTPTARICPESNAPHAAQTACMVSRASGFGCARISSPRKPQAASIQSARAWRSDALHSSCGASHAQSLNKSEHNRFSIFSDCSASGREWLKSNAGPRSPWGDFSAKIAISAPFSDPPRLNPLRIFLSSRNALVFSIRRRFGHRPSHRPLLRQRPQRIRLTILLHGLVEQRDKQSLFFHRIQ